MKIRDLIPGGNVAVVITYAVGAFVLAAMIWYFVVARPAAKEREAAQARVESITAKGDERATAAAAKAVGELSERQRERDEMERDNRDEILSQPGAGTAVDPGVHDATLRSLCRREIYRGSRACVRLRQEGSAQPQG